MRTVTGRFFVVNWDDGFADDRSDDRLHNGRTSHLMSGHVSLGDRTLQVSSVARTSHSVRLHGRNGVGGTWFESGRDERIRCVCVCV
jgi:hypothetical protein